MDRRTLITSAPVIGFAGLPALASGAETQILCLFRRHCAILDAAHDHVTTLTGEEEDEEIQRLFYDEADAILDLMLALPSSCAADFAAKVIVDTVKGGCVSPWKTGKLWIEARTLVGVEA